ncbi:MAG TPA: 6-phosphogluconate dehydrogenase (decarboxylating), partial [Actinomycetota bacterium]|nr:6-phosphogluconate dehydrogenase (decarboxylating) [Actinomycetota bacterium]
EGVPAQVLSAAVFDRFASQGSAEFANKVLSAMRKEFGGHDEKAST